MEERRLKARESHCGPPIQSRRDRIVPDPNSARTSMSPGRRSKTPFSLHSPRPAVAVAPRIDQGKGQLHRRSLKAVWNVGGLISGDVAVGSSRMWRDGSRRNSATLARVCDRSRLLCIPKALPCTASAYSSSICEPLSCARTA